MNGNYGIGEIGEMEDFDESFDEAGYDDFDEFDEAVARRPSAAARRRPPVRTAPRQSAYRPRPTPATTTGGVTQAQLQAALAKVSSQIATNSNAIKTVDGRVRNLTSEQARVTTALRKEMAERKKNDEAVRKEIQSTRELAAIIPIVAQGNPVLGLLFAGMGGSSPLGGSSSDGSGNSNSLLLLLALSGGLLAPPAPPVPPGP